MFNHPSGAPLSADDLYRAYLLLRGSHDRTMRCVDLGEDIEYTRCAKDLVQSILYSRARPPYARFVPDHPSSRRLPSQLCAYLRYGDIAADIERIVQVEVMALRKGSPDLWKLCAAAEEQEVRAPAYRGVRHAMRDKTVQMATELYAKAVLFCDQGGFPYSSIRVEAATGGPRPAKNGRNLNETSFGTALRWDGEDWGVCREIRRWHGYQVQNENAYPDGMQFVQAWLALDSRPAAMFRSRKTREKEEYRVTVAVWVGDHQEDGRFVEENNPWATPKPTHEKTTTIRRDDNDGGTAYVLSNGERFVSYQEAARRVKQLASEINVIGFRDLFDQFDEEVRVQQKRDEEKEKERLLWESLRKIEKQTEKKQESLVEQVQRLAQTQKPRPVWEDPEAFSRLVQQILGLQNPLPPSEGKGDIPSLQAWIDILKTLKG